MSIKGTNGMSKNYKRIAQVFVKQYNLAKGTQYEYEGRGKSMFSVSKHRPPGCELYQMAFIEGQKRNPIITDLMVITHLKKRLIIEVVEPEIRREAVEGRVLSRLIEDIVNSIEREVLNGVTCSNHLLIDGRGFGNMRIGDPEIYKKPRLQREKLLQELQKGDGRKPSKAGNPAKRWFKEIWLLCHDEKGTARCLQMW